MKYQGTGLVKTKVRYSYKKGQGLVTETVFVGTRAAIEGLVGILQSTFDEFNIEHNGPVWSCTARFSGDLENPGEAANVVNDVRSSANRVVKKIWKHPRYSAVSDSDLKFIQKAVNGHQTLHEAYGSDTVSFPDIVEELYTKVLREEGWIIYQPVLQRTWTAASNYQFNQPYYANIRRIFQSAAMPTELDIPPNEIGFQLPDEQSGNADLVYGWLKHYPEYFKGAGQKAVMSQDYEYGLWDVDIYGFAQ